MKLFVSVVCAFGALLLPAQAESLFDLHANVRWREELAGQSARLAAQRIETARQANALGCLAYCPSLNDIFQRLRVVALEQLPASRDSQWLLVVTRLPGEEAWALPDGHVFISEVFVQAQALTRDEIAFVLAHEIAHFALAHEADTVDIARRLMPFGLSASVGDIYATLDMDLGLLLRMAPMLADMELEADGVGLALTALAGYDPDRAHAFLRKLAAMDQDGGMATSHPTARRRLQSIEAVLPLARRLYEERARIMHLQ